jgi:dihydropteroate synthase
MQDIHVDEYGIRIMLPKAITHLVKINSISNITANILKQEMLSLGGDVAVARGALTGKSKQTDCLLMGSLAQFNRLNAKLKQQPFGLDKLSKQLSGTLANYQKDSFRLNLGSYRLNLTRRAHIMGIVNITPDSFSQDGLYNRNRDEIVSRAEQLVNDGADIIDVGGESTRPHSRTVPVREELRRTIAVIKSLAKKLKVPISIDTRKPEVARQALDNGAVMVNDITGLRNKKMAKLISKYKAGVVIMHMQGTPKTMQINPEYESLIDDIIAYLDTSIKQALAAGVDENKIIIDPGIGFGKTSEHNLEILKKLGEFRVLGKPILVGPSRKSFLGKILKTEPQKRLFGTVSACVLAAKNGANLVRVHDVKAVKEALKVLDAIDKT